MTPTGLAKAIAVIRADIEWLHSEAAAQTDRAEHPVEVVSAEHTEAVARGMERALAILVGHGAE